MLTHRGRRTWADRHDQLPAEAFETTYRNLVLEEHPLEFRFGFQLAFTRILAIPSMAALLAHTGQIPGQPKRRTHDTRIAMYEIFANGLNSPRSLKMIALMNRLHGRYDLSDDDMRHVLVALMVVPSRVINQAGWRPVTHHEQDAIHQFYSHLGTQIGVRQIPTSYAAAEALLDQLDNTHASRDDNTLLLSATTVDVIAGQLPRGLRWVTPHLLGAAIDNPTVAHALGLPRRWPTRTLFAALTCARRTVLPMLPMTHRVEFTPGAPISDMYPHGYHLHEIGPDQ